MRFILNSFGFALLLILLVGCASHRPALEPPEASAHRVIELNRAILALDASIDPAEARRAARISIEYSSELAQSYQITSSPLLHNVMVNLGMKPRGLCVDWTRDLLTRLKQERFRSLELHWGIANYQSLFRIEHSTVIVSARDDTLQQGLVLDPWRHGGRLFWAPTLEDPDYRWYPQAEIHALKRQRQERREQLYVSR